jgi:UDP-N-acetylmuramate dehydrogenase
VNASRDLEGLVAALGPRVRRNEALANYTAMRIGGPADLLLVCESADEVVRAVKLARQYGVDFRLLGGGCNVLVSDSGVRGLVIVNASMRASRRVSARIVFEADARPACRQACLPRHRQAGQAVEGMDYVQAEAGAPLTLLARETVERGLAGLEWAAGLPGAVGGAVVGNAGAFGGDVAGVLSSATVLDPYGEIVERPNAWFEFTYRGSRLKQPDNRTIVLAATFTLTPGDREELAARAEEYVTWRKTRHPLGATMGSTFKNPSGYHAGRLIEHAGLLGYRVGGAQVSEKHGNFLINTGDATAADVLRLIERIREVVQRRFGVTLELEIQLLGR